MKRLNTIRTIIFGLIFGIVLIGKGHLISNQPSIAAEQKSAMPNLQGKAAEDYLKQQGLFDGIKSKIDAERHEVKWSSEVGRRDLGGAYQADNPEQNLRASFSRNGAVITPSKLGDSKAKWQTEMSLRAVGYGQRLSGVVTGLMRSSGNRMEYFRSVNLQSAIRNPQLREWYVNKAEGIEQGFTLSERPGLRAGLEPLRLALEVKGGLKASLEDDRQAVTLSYPNGRQALRYDHLVAYDAVGQTLPSRMEVDGDQISLLIEDANAVYPLTIDPLFTEVKKVVASDGEAGDTFGISVAISGDMAIVGAPSDDGYKGSAYILERNKGGADNWGEIKKLVASDGASNDQFGFSVGISGDTVIVGAYADDSFQGSAYIYERNNGGSDNWGEVKKLVASDGAADDEFGYSVAISGDVAIVGARSDDSTKGSAYVFERNTGGAGNWGEVNKLTASDGVGVDSFGKSVAISIDTILIGADGSNSGRGAAYIYERNMGGADNWGEVKKLVASDGVSGDLFGYSASISVDTVIVGAVGDDSNRGSAYIYERNTGGADNWGQAKKLVASDGVADDGFGVSVAISGDTVIIGARDDDRSKGSAYIYERNTGGVNNWGNVKKLVASDGARNDQFGTSVAIGVGTAIIGAPLDDAKGSAYIFASDCDWIEKRKPIASDGATGDQFGSSVAISGDTAIIGAESDDTLTGSAYILERNKGGGDNWGEVKKLVASDAGLANRFGISVAISGDTAIVGAGTSGAAYIFLRNQGGADNWGEFKKLTGSSHTAGYNFGWSVAISGDTAIIGAPFDGAQTGSAYIFERNKGGADNWGEAKKLTVTGSAVGDRFGWSVAISDDTAISGAYRADGSKGAAFIYERNKGGADNWGEVKKLTASDGVANDFFGLSVAISGDIAVAGAFGDESNRGSAYLYLRNAGGADNWGEFKKLTASDGVANDFFGWSVAISQDTAIVGARDNSGKGAAYVYERNKGGSNTWGESKKFIASDGAAGDKFGSSAAISGMKVIVGAPDDDSSLGSAYIFACNKTPTINPVGVSRQRGSIVSNSTIANVNDADQAANTLTVTVNGGTSATVNGVTVSGIVVDAAGVVTADVVAECTSTNANFTLAVTDNLSQTATATLNVTTSANSIPVLTYNNQTVAAGSALMINPATGPTDNGSISSFVVQSSGTYTGTISVDNSTGVVSISGADPVGTHTITIRATDNCGATKDATFTLMVTCQAITVIPPIASNGFVGTPYSQIFIQSGGRGAITWSSTGTLPDGLMLDSSTGELAGTPTAVGSFTFTIRATDQNNCFGETQYTVVISGTGLQFYPLAHPVRMVDTRSGATACQTPGAPITGNTSLTVPARGLCDLVTIPANAAAVTGNVTTVGPVANGFLTIYPSDAAQPQAANTNYQTGQTLNNVFTVGLGAGDGAFKIFALSTTDVVVDVTGYFAPPGLGGLFFHPLPAPVRLLDTRLGQTACTMPGTPIPATTEVVQQGHGICGIPISAVALVGNATTVDPVGQGFLTMFPAGTTRPLVASGNYQAGQTLNSPFTIALSPPGGFTIYSSQQTDLVIDVLGYYSVDVSDAAGIGLLFSPMTPARLLDTRTGQTACFTPGVAIPATTDTPQAARGVCTIPATAQAIVGNATTVTPAAQGFLTFWPSDAMRPTVATSNYAAGVNFNRHYTVGLGTDGAFKIYALTTTHLVVDVSGSFAP